MWLNCTFALENLSSEQNGVLGLFGFLNVLLFFFLAKMDKWAGKNAYLDKQW